MQKKTNEKFIEELKEKNPNIIARGEYIDSSTKIEVECKKCGYIWKANPGTLVHGRGCPRCANNIRKTTNEFSLEMKSINPYIKILDEYHSANELIKVKCLICGNTWFATPSRLLRGAQCMQCLKPHTSFMEQYILIAFKDVIGDDKVISRDLTAIGQELDIYVPCFDFAVEPGTWLYHEKKANGSDKEKRMMCAKNGIRLITIYDSYPEGKCAPFKNDCFVYSGFLNEKGFQRIKELVIKLLQMLGIFEIRIDWNNVANKAYEACHYNANDTFRNNLKKLYPNIEVLEEYKGSNIPILVDNKNCKHPPWKARPYTLLKGIGCPLCGREAAAETRTRTHDQFLDKLHAVNPSINVLGQYSKITERIEVECLECGYKWKPLGYSLLQGKSCPHCSAIAGARKRTGSRKAKTTAKFIEEVLAINPFIEVLGEYKNNKTKIAVSCKKCGYKWEVVPESLINGHGCPKCSRKSIRKKEQ